MRLESCVGVERRVALDKRSVRLVRCLRPPIGLHIKPLSLSILRAAICAVPAVPLVLPYVSELLVIVRGAACGSADHSCSDAPHPSRPERDLTPMARPDSLVSPRRVACTHEAWMCTPCGHVCALVHQLGNAAGQRQGGGRMHQDAACST